MKVEGDAVTILRKATFAICFGITLAGSAKAFEVSQVAWGETAGGLSVGLAVSNTNYRTNEPIIVSVFVRNDSEKTMRLPVYPLAVFFDLIATDEHGQLLPRKPLPEVDTVKTLPAFTPRSVHRVDLDLRDFLIISNATRLVLTARRIQGGEHALSGNVTISANAMPPTSLTTEPVTEPLWGEPENGVRIGLVTSNECMSTQPCMVTVVVHNDSDRDTRLAIPPVEMLFDFIATDESGAMLKERSKPLVNAGMASRPFRKETTHAFDLDLSTYLELPAAGRFLLTATMNHLGTPVRSGNAWLTIASADKAQHSPTPSIRGRRTHRAQFKIAGQEAQRAQKIRRLSRNPRELNARLRRRGTERPFQSVGCSLLLRSFYSGLGDVRDE